MFELEGLRGISRVIDADASGRPLGQPDELCKFVKISNWTTDDDDDNTLTIPTGNSLVEETTTEIYYGYDKTYAHQLFAGRDTEFLPCQNLGQISVRARKGSKRKVFFTYFF